MKDQSIVEGNRFLTGPDAVFDTRRERFLTLAAMFCFRYRDGKIRTTCSETLSRDARMRGSSRKCEWMVEIDPLFSPRNAFCTPGQESACCVRYSIRLKSLSFAAGLWCLHNCQEFVTQRDTHTARISVKNAAESSREDCFSARKNQLSPRTFRAHIQYTYLFLLNVQRSNIP